MAIDLFRDWLPSIMHTKKSVIRDELDEKDYKPFYINRALGLHKDCIFYANQMNQLSELAKIAQYDYFMGSIRAIKRPFVPWPKKTKDDDLALVIHHFQYSRSKAQAALSILNEEHLEELRQAYKHLNN
ncbi:MAG: DNA polymerase clamp loader subunit A [Candidatus Dormibacteria bacterium]